MEYKPIAKKSDIPDNTMKKFEVDDLEITIAHFQGAFYAFNDRCPHMNAPLHMGKLREGEVECPFHKARFEVSSGKKIKDPKIPIPKIIKLGNMMANIKTHNLHTYNVKIEEDTIFIK